MGTKGKEIVAMDTAELVRSLNRAFADEWLSYYQYWIGAKVVTGPMREAVASELEEHAVDELRHAAMLTERIIHLGGTPVLKPEDWSKATNCGYDSPEDPSTKAVLEQNIKGEQCAIDVYNRLLQTVKEKDPITYDIVLEIMKDEVEHEDDLQSLVEDLQGMFSK